MSNLQPPLQNTLVFLYDSEGKILFVSSTHPPYQPKDVKGKPAWHALGKHDEHQCQAALFRAMNSLSYETIDVDVAHVGRWRCEFFGCRLGRIRVVGVSRKIPDKIFDLSERQTEVCRLLAEGLASKQIASRLGCSVTTIDNHRANAAAKLGIDSRALVAWCGANRDWLQS